MDRWMIGEIKKREVETKRKKKHYNGVDEREVSGGLWLNCETEISTRMNFSQLIRAEGISENPVWGWLWEKGFRVGALYSTPLPSEDRAIQ